MVSKRFFLIAGGTVGGLGAVLSITPPQFGATTGLSLSTGKSLSGSTTSLSGGTTSLSGGTTTVSTPVATPSAAVANPTPAATKAKTTVKKKTTTKKKTSTGTTTSTTTGTTTAVTTPTPVSTPKATAAEVSGTFTGAAGNTRYGPVQVQITVVNNKITNAIALTYPTESFRDQQINQQAIPYLIQETLAAQSANIQGVGGASYTSQGWVDSLQSALSKAGL